MALAALTAPAFALDTDGITVTPARSEIDRRNALVAIVQVKNESGRDWRTLGYSCAVLDGNNSPLDMGTGMITNVRNGETVVDRVQFHGRFDQDPKIVCRASYALNN